MPQGPYGLGLGLSAVGAGVSEGINRGLMLGPQVEQARLQNQATQLGLQQKMGEFDALRQPVAPVQESLTPYDQPLAELNQIESAARAGGDMNALRDISQQKTVLQQRRTQHLLGMGAKVALGGGTQEAVKLLNAGGINVQNISPNPDGSFTLQFQGQPPQVVSKDYVRQLAMTPAEGAAFDYRQAGLGHKEEELAFKREKLTKQREAQDKKLENALLLGRERIAGAKEVAKIQAGGRVAQATIAQEGANRRFDRTPGNRLFSYLTDSPDDGGLGMDPKAAMTQLRSYNQRKPGESPDLWAYKQAIRSAGAAGRGDDAEYIDKLQKLYVDALPPAQEPAPTAPPTPPPAAAPAPSAAPAASGKYAGKVMSAKDVAKAAKEKGVTEEVIKNNWTKNGGKLIP